MLKIVLTSMMLAACATGTSGVGRDRGKNFELTIAEQTGRSFPTAIDPQLPSVDRIARILQTRFGNRADAEIDLCVSSDGRVARVTLVQGSAYEAFDAALLRDIADWEFTPAARPALRTCKRATVSYRLPS